MVATAQISDPVGFLLGQQHAAPPKVNWESLPKAHKLIVVQGLLAKVKKADFWAHSPGFKPIAKWATDMAKPDKVLPWITTGTGVDFGHYCLYLMKLPTGYVGKGASRTEIEHQLLIDRDGDLYNLEMKFGFKSRAGQLEWESVEWTTYKVKDDLIDLISALGLELIQAVDEALDAALKHWQGKIDRCQGLRGEFTRFYERVE